MQVSPSLMKVHFTPHQPGLYSPPMYEVRTAFINWMLSRFSPSWMVLRLGNQGILKSKKEEMYLVEQ